MKYLVPFLLLSLSHLKGQGQTESSKISIEVSTGLAYSFMYNPPVALLSCDEGCFPEKQIPKPGFRLASTINVVLKEKHQLSSSIYFHEMRFKENGMASDGSPRFYPYQYQVDIPYLGIELSHRYYFRVNEKTNFYISNGIQGEVMLVSPDWDLRNFGFSYIGKPGIEYRIGAKSNFVLSPLFRTALLRYNHTDNGKAFYPFGLGLMAGMRWNI